MRRDGARRAIRENGVTYNVYGDPQGIDRPWELDMVPLIVSADEWQWLERGLMQRTRLLNLILLDLHGPQRLLRSGLLPASLALASPAFLRPCHGIRVPRDTYLHMHGVDLARSPDGQWVVLADRTQAPSGAGYALENRLVLLHSLPEAFRGSEIQRLASFFRSQRDALSALVPEDFVTQEHVDLSSAPVWHRQRLEPRSVVLRTYVAAAGDSFTVMPGGLTRVSSTQEIPIVSMQRGGKSKDTWILADNPVSSVSLLSPPDPTRLEPATTELPSRVAESLFWLGRYVERAEHFVRLLRSFISRLADQDTTDDPRQVSALVRVLVGLRVLPEDLGKDRLLRKLEEDTRDLIARQGPHTGLRNTLNEVRRLASAVRDRLSIDTWRILNQLHQDMRGRQGRIQFEEVLVYLNRIITDLAAFSGMEMENMTRGHGWRFLNLGRRLERSANLIGVLRGALDVSRDHVTEAGAVSRSSQAPFDRAADHATADGTARSPAIVEPLLEVADSSMTYRRRCYAQPRLAPALHLLLADDTNTRGLSFQLAAVSEHALRLPRDPEAPSPTREERLIAHALETLNEVVVSQAWSEDDPARLDGLLGSIEDDLKALSDAVTHFYFSHAELRVS